MKECDNFSEDVKFWAEYKTGIKEFKPWLAEAEKKSTEGLSKPQTLDEANAMFAVVKTFEGSCHKHYKVTILIETLCLQILVELYLCWNNTFLDQLITSMEFQNDQDRSIYKSCNFYENQIWVAIFKHFEKHKLWLLILQAMAAQVCCQISKLCCHRLKVKISAIL